MSTFATLPSTRPATMTPAGDNSAAQPPAQPDGRSRPAQGSPGRRGAAVLASLVINFAVPLAAYYELRHHGASSAAALALSGAIPVAYTVVVLAIRRRLDPLGVISIVSFALGVLISWVSGGNTLALELQDPALTGLAGIACLISVALRRPLHPYLLRLLGRSDAKYTDIARRAQHGTSMLTTLIIGLAFTGHAIAITILALTEPASRFVALQNPVGLPFFGVGIAVLFFYRSRLQARQRTEAAATAADAATPADDGQPGQQS
jgi:drug/metabolite transporter (DMT)-like permease